ncbi:hypothetical protein RB195_020967 [Necator americanus]|uniref:Metalloendopeptidase n=1 Tax=Necator americanus TaxID=51031 RepID=A0ABR1CM98_NECAM
MFVIGIALLICFVNSETDVPTLRELVNPSEQYALRDTLSSIIEEQYKDNVISSVYLLFVGNDDGCWSTVGRDAAQGQQLVSIGRGCEAFGITSHELAHALGLFHEQSRYDRDNWITIYPQRIPKSQLYNFAKVSPKQMKMYGTPYDIGSVMQYTPFEFSIDPRIPSMLAVNINEQGSMGQLAGPSYLDIQIMNAHYACGCSERETNPFDDREDKGHMCTRVLERNSRVQSPHGQTNYREQVRGEFSPIAP